MIENPDCRKRIEAIFPESIEISFEKITFTKNELKDLYNDYREECKRYGNEPASVMDWIEIYFGEETCGNCWEYLENNAEITIDKVKINK